MDHSRSRRQKTQKETAAPDRDQDLISNLPEEIKGSILSYISTRDAVKTSILSTRWRYSWACVPDISIKEADFAMPHASKRITRPKFVNFVDVLLYLHTGPIFTFKLETENFTNEHYFRDSFDRWILHLSRRNELREFSFIFCSVYLLKLPASLFSCHGLSSLKLCDCHIKLPRGFQGFKLMRVLELQGCSVSSDDLENIVSYCPILEELVMKTVRYPIPDFHFKIYAPKLKKLIIHGKFATLLLRTPCLVNACFELEVVPTGINGCANLVEALCLLPEVEILRLRQQFFAFLAAGDLPNHLPSPVNKLKILALDVNLSSPKEATLTWLLLQNAPNLQEIYLTNSTSGLLQPARFWQIGPADLFMNLRIVELYDEFFISEQEIEFLRLVLGSTPSLEQLTIVRNKRTNAKKKESVVELLKGFPKLSWNAQIKFE